MQTLGHKTLQKTLHLTKPKLLKHSVLHYKHFMFCIESFSPVCLGNKIFSIILSFNLPFSLWRSG